MQRLGVAREEEAPGTDITISSLSSPELATVLMQNRMDVALLRREIQTSGLAFKFLVKEPIVVILPATHRLAKHKTIRLRDLARKSFIAGSTVQSDHRTQRSSIARWYRS
jgi:LysR family hca operon transcriptional activator